MSKSSVAPVASIFIMFGASVWSAVARADGIMPTSRDQMAYENAEECGVLEAVRHVRKENREVLGQGLQHSRDAVAEAHGAVEKCALGLPEADRRNEFIAAQHCKQEYREWLASGLSFRLAAAEYRELKEGLAVLEHRMASKCTRVVE